MYGYDFYAVEKLGRKLREIEFDKKLEEDSLYQIINQDILKLGRIEEKKGNNFIIKPIIIDDNFEIYNNLVEKIYCIYKENGENTINLFNKKSIDLRDLYKEKEFQVMSGEYIKEQYKELLEELSKSTYIKIPSVYSIKGLNNSNKHLNIKLNIRLNNVNLLKKEAKILDNCHIESVFYYTYFFDKNTKQIKNFFMDDRINEIFLSDLDNILINPKNDYLDKNLEYVEIAGIKVPYTDGVKYNKLYQNYSFGKAIIKKYFSFKLYGIVINIFPSEMNITNKNELLFLFELFKNEIEKIEKINSDKKRFRDVGILQLLYSIYNKININTEYKQLSFIPYTFIFNVINGKKYEIYKTLDGITFGGIISILEKIGKKLNLSDFSKILEQIEIITSNRVCFSNYLLVETKGGGTFEQAPGNDFLKKIDFIGELCMTDDIDYVLNKYLNNISNFIINQKIKKFNKTSMSGGRYGDWYVYKTVRMLLGDKENIDIDLDEKYYQKNKVLIGYLREQIKNSNSFLPNFISKLLYYYNDLEKIKKYLEESLIFYVEKGVEGMTLDKKKVRLIKVLEPINREDILYTLGKVLYGLELGEDKIHNGILYNEDKRFTYAGIINSDYKSNNKYKLIYGFISKVYFNYNYDEEKRNRILLENILYFLNYIDNKEKIYIKILSNFVS